MTSKSKVLDLLRQQVLEAVRKVLGETHRAARVLGASREELAGILLEPLLRAAADCAAEAGTSRETFDAAAKEIADERFRQVNRQNGVR